MAVQSSRQIVIEAPPAAIMDALADVESMLTYSPAYRGAEVIDRYADGRPHHVRIAVKILWRVDEEILEYQWGPDWLVWDAQRTRAQNAQHVEYRLRTDHTGTSTLVTMDMTFEPHSFLPDFFIRRAGESILDAATR